MKIFIPISVGELFDKCTILSIKLDKIKDSKKKEILAIEFDLLVDKVRGVVKRDIKKVVFFKKLIVVNTKLWDVENRIRKMEAGKDFGKEFIELARLVYKTNDKRSKIKADINKYYDSEIVEVKIYK